MAATAWRCPYCKKTRETNARLRKHIEETHMDFLATKHLKKKLAKSLKVYQQNAKSKKAAAKQKRKPQPKPESRPAPVAA